MEDRLQKLIEESEGSDLESADSSPSAVAIIRFVRHQVHSRCVLTDTGMWQQRGNRPHTSATALTDTGVRQQTQIFCVFG